MGQNMGTVAEEEQLSRLLREKKTTFLNNSVEQISYYVQSLSWCGL